MTEPAAARARWLWSALACFVLFAIVAVLVRQHWAPLQSLDTGVGTGPQLFTYDHHGFRAFWVDLGAVTSTWPLSVLTLVLVAALVWRRHHRAAIWAAAAMVTASVATVVLKQLVGRARPVWLHPIETLRSPSFPSGHSSGIAALAGVCLVLVAIYVRRRRLRHVLGSAVVAVAVLVGADRIFLGVHNLSDVLAGWVLGAGIVLLWLGLYDPLPRSIALVNAPLPEAVPKAERTLGAILNPVKVDDAGQFRAQVEAQARAAGFAGVQWWETTVEDTGYRMAHEAAVSGADVVVAIGGDGTIRAVCEELAGTGVPVGIVPAGTGNLLARNLGIPLYLRAAVDVALNGQDRAIDMVAVEGDEMEDSVYLVMAGMGFDAAIMEGVNESFKARVGWLAYVWSAVKTMMFPAIRVEISVDDEPFTKHRARTVVVGNVGTLQAGMPLLPDAEIDDGRIDLVLLYPRRFLSWVPLAARVLTKSSRSDSTIMRMSGQRVVVRASAAAPRQLDGDLIAPGREIRAACVHGRLLVRVPR